MNIHSLADAFEAAERAETNVLDALEAADAAGLKVDWDALPTVTIERAALAALMVASPSSADEAERRRLLVRRMRGEGNHSDIVGVDEGMIRVA